MPTACRLSQTLGHASSLIMKARLQFVAPHERSRKTQLAAGASRSERSLKATERASAGRPSFGGLRAVELPRRQENAQRLHAPLALTRKASCKSASLPQPREPRFFSRYLSTGSVPAAVGNLAHPALVCFAIQIQSKVAPPRAWPNPSFKRTGLRPAA